MRRQEENLQDLEPETLGKLSLPLERGGVTSGRLDHRDRAGGNRFPASLMKH